MAWLVLAGCTGAPVITELPHDHPAHPEAQSAADQPAPDPFQSTATYVPPGVGDPAPASAAEDNRQSTPAAAADAQFTCPMHPSVIQKTPGNCPLCGMRLRPIQPVKPHDHKSKGEQP